MEKTKQFFIDEIKAIKEVFASGQVKGQEVIDFHNERLKLYNECLNEVNFISVNNSVSGNEANAKYLQSGEVAVCHRCKENGDMYIDTNGRWRCARCHEAAN